MISKRLFLLDAYALIFRGYYAFIKNPRINSKGMDTSAIFGFMNSLLDVIRNEKPEYLAVVFDKEGSKKRTELFPEYKANRQETPEAIKIAVPYIQEILKSMHIPVVEVPGFEADDLIGTLSKQAEKESFEVFMVTPDKDFAQLVSPNIKMYRPARMGNGIEIWDVEKVKEKFEVSDPLQVIDYLGMMGDAVDNIPGLPGVGDKTAKKFIKQYGSMEGLLENTHELKGKMKEKVEENKALGLLSKELATILLDCPVTFSQDLFLMSTPDMDKVSSIFEELEFRRMMTSFQKLFTPADLIVTEGNKGSNQKAEVEQLGLFSFGNEGNESKSIEFQNTGKKTIEQTDHHYQAVYSVLGLRLLVSKLMKQTSVCFDVETTGLDTFSCELLGISFAYEMGKAYYVDLPKDKAEKTSWLNELKPFFESVEIEKVGHNIKFDIKVLAQYEVEVKGELFDTMIAHYLLQPEMRHGMDVLSETYLQYSPISIESLIGKKGKNQLTLDRLDRSQLTDYAAEDADVTLRLKIIFEEQLKEAHLQQLFKDIEMPLLNVLVKMELEGIAVDVDYLKKLSVQTAKDIDVLEKDIIEQAGVSFNLASPKQLGEILFEKLRLVEKPKKTKTGQYATNEEVLSKLAEKHQIVQNILEWRGLQKLKSTYIDALPEEVKPSGRIHTTFGQAVAATGRLSSNNPNIQNIPIRTERGQQIRKAFVPRSAEYVLLAADYSQIELRIIAAMSEETNMTEAFQKGLDIHATTASKVFGVDLEEVTREQRSRAKAVNFGILYGQGAFTLSQQTGLSRSEAKQLIDQYYDTYPKLRKFMDEQVAYARTHKYVQTILGRKRYLNNIHSQNSLVRSADERNAVNTPIQGSAADVIKVAMIRIQKELEEKALKSKLLIQVHDELVFDVLVSELDEVKDLVKRNMEGAYKMAVPLEVELGEGSNWLQAH